MNSQMSTAHIQDPHASPDGLFHAVMSRIEREKKLRRVRYQAYTAMVIFIASTASLYFVLDFVRDGLAQSGFLQLAELLFVDGIALASVWQNFVFALLETIPIIPILVFFLAMFVTSISLSVMTKCFVSMSKMRIYRI